MSRDPDSPGVSPFTWATLGLLAFSWLALSGLSVRDHIHSPTPHKLSLTDEILIWMVMSGPFYLLGLSTWLMRHKPPRFIVPMAAFYAMFYAFVTAWVVAAELFGIGGIGIGFLCVWISGWPAGALGLVAALTDIAHTEPPTSA